jgi:hypothetical protein
MTPEARDKVVRSVAARYKARCWWAETDDLIQVGSEAALHAARTFDPRVGVPEDAYLRRSVALAIKGWLWKQSAPVTGGDRDTRKGLRRAPIEDAEGIPLLHCALPSPEGLVVHKEWVDEVRARMVALTEHDPVAAAGLRLLLDEGYPAEDDESADEAYKARNRARTCLQSDPTIWRMLRHKETP